MFNGARDYRRLIVAQAVPGSTRKALKYVFNLNAKEETVEPYLGYTTMNLVTNSLFVVQKNNDSYLEIRPTVGAGSKVSNWVRLSSTDFAGFIKALEL